MKYFSKNLIMILNTISIFKDHYFEYSRTYLRCLLHHFGRVLLDIFTMRVLFDTFDSLRSMKIKLKIKNAGARFDRKFGKT